MYLANTLTALFGFIAAAQYCNGETITYTYPTTNYPAPHTGHANNGGMVHGICVLGAKEASASISPDKDNFTYTSIKDLQDGVKTFADHAFVFSGINGNGVQVCEGGIYLQPSYGLVRFSLAPRLLILFVSADPTPFNFLSFCIILSNIQKRLRFDSVLLNRDPQSESMLLCKRLSRIRRLVSLCVHLLKTRSPMTAYTTIV